MSGQTSSPFAEYKEYFSSPIKVNNLENVILIGTIGDVRLTKSARKHVEHVEGMTKYKKSALVLPLS